MITLPPQARHALAAEVGMNEQYLYQCLTRRKPFPVERVVPLESAAKRLGIAGVTRRSMRPDDWRIHWPELSTQEPDRAAA